MTSYPTIIDTMKAMNAKWYTNPQLLTAARNKYGTFEAIERAIGGVDSSTLSFHWRKMGLEKLPKGPAPQGKTPINEEALRELYKSTYGES